MPGRRARLACKLDKASWGETLSAATATSVFSCWDEPPKLRREEKIGAENLLLPCVPVGDAGQGSCAPRAGQACHPGLLVRRRVGAQCDDVEGGSQLDEAIRDCSWRGRGVAVGDQHDLLLRLLARGTSGLLVLQHVESSSQRCAEVDDAVRDPRARRLLDPLARHVIGSTQSALAPRHVGDQASSVDPTPMYPRKVLGRQHESDRVRGAQRGDQGGCDLLAHVLAVELVHGAPGVEHQDQAPRG
eukprot:197164-Hanusia_phi.AAC.2